MPERPWQERILVLLLRITGAVTLSALVAMVMPNSMMREIHAWLGLGDLAEDAITEYMARSLSALYGVHGALLLVLSTDVRGLRRVIVFVGVMYLFLGVSLLGIDLHAGMPSWWTLGEGPPVIGLGVALLWLLRAVPAK